jgi:hypothetical protein
MWNHVVTKKVLNISKYISYFKFFKVTTICLDDSFAHSWHSLIQLHEVVTWNAFKLTGVPCSFVEFLSSLLCVSQSVVL